jgi:hypothetical protein
MIYKDKEISDFTDQELADTIDELVSAEAIREEASKHHKFDKINNNKALEFPPINPEYLKLKDAINSELESRKKYNA